MLSSSASQTIQDSYNTSTTSFITPQHTNSSQKTFTSQLFSQKCEFENNINVGTNRFYGTLKLELPSVYSSVYGLPSSFYFDCINFLFSGHIPDHNNPKVFGSSSNNNNPQLQALNLPYLRPSGVFTLFEVISNSNQTNVEKGQITLSDIICTAEIDAQFSQFYPFHRDIIEYTPDIAFSSIHRLLTKDIIMYLRFVCHEYVNHHKFIHYGHTPLTLLHNNRQYILIHHPLLIQRVAFFFFAYSAITQTQLLAFSFRLFFTLRSLSRATLSLNRHLLSNPVDPMIFDLQKEVVTNHHMVSPILYLNCLSELSLHTFYSFIMALLKAKNDFSTSETNITIILQNSHILDQTLFITSDLVTDTIYEYFHVGANIIHEGITRHFFTQIPTRPSSDEYFPDLSTPHSPFSDDPSYIPYNDGFAGIAPFTVSDVTDEIDAAGAAFSQNFCKTFLTPIVTQLFFEPNSGLTLSSSFNQLTCSTTYHLITASPHLTPNEAYIPSEFYIPRVKIPSRIPHPSSLISLYHSMYYNQCRQRQWHLFAPLGVQHLSFSMYTVFIGYNPDLINFGRPSHLFYPLPLTFEYFVSTQAKTTSFTSYPLTLVNNKLLLDAIPISYDENSCESEFRHISLPPSLSPLHPHYFNTSERNSTSLTPIFALKEPEQTSTQTILSADLFSQLPPELYQDQFTFQTNSTCQADQTTTSTISSNKNAFSSTPHTDFSITLDSKKRAQFYKFKYAGEVAKYVNKDYTASIHYFRCPTSHSKPPSSDQINARTFAANDDDEITSKSNRKTINISLKKDSPSNELEFRIVSPDLNFPSRPCRLLPLFDSPHVLSDPLQILFTLPMNQIIALEYYLQNQKHQIQTPSAIMNTKQCHSRAPLSDIQSSTVLGSDSSPSQKSLLNKVNTAADYVSVHSNPSAISNNLIDTLVATSNMMSHKASPTSTIAQDRFNPLSNSNNKYYHIEIFNKLTTSLEMPLMYEDFFNNIASQPFSCPGVILLTPYSQHLPYINLYSAETYRYTANLVQIDINIPFFFITVLPQEFDITTASLESMTSNDVPYLGWDTSFPVDRLQTFFSQVASKKKTSLKSKPSKAFTPNNPNNSAQVQSDTVINFQRDLIFQKSRHIQVFSTVVPHDMNEYINLKNSTSQHGEKIELTHSYNEEIPGQISQVQHFLQGIQKQQTDLDADPDAQGSCERSMFHFVVSGIQGYINALPFINKCALAHYFSYRLLPPQVD